MGNSVVLAPKTQFNPIVRVNRNALYAYPEWKKGFLNPAYARSGPDKFDLREVERWFLPEQKVSEVSGHVVYAELKRTETLSRCLNLHDGLAIKKRGIDFLLHFFGHKVIFFWGSTIVGEDGGVDVPYLAPQGNKIVLGWKFLDLPWRANDVTPRFKK